MRLRPRAEVFIFKRNRILCAPRKDHVVFPGGGIDPNESAKDAAIRETFEEAGRRLINCTVAHPPTVQKWSKEYIARKSEWKDGYEGGFTYWMTGSSADNPVSPGLRHEDYESGMDWRSVREVIEMLKKELSGDWGDDAKVRSLILETHLAMQKTHKIADARIQSLFKADHLFERYPKLNLSGEVSHG